MNNNVIESATAIGAETAQEGDINEKVYTFRKLNATDTFLMFKILSKINIKDAIKNINMDALKEANNDATAVGVAVMMELVNIVLANLPDCENEVFQLLANTSNMSVGEIRKLDFVIFVGMVLDFIKKEEFKDFFGVVTKSFNLAK